jgi:NADH:ubiquinone reductase (H+-translocating)
MKLANIPENKNKRIVISGAGFGGLKLARHLAGSDYQVVLLDKNNYHSFQPLFYQVATAGIEPSAISFPLRKIFQKYRNVHVRMARVMKVDPEQNEIETSIGNLRYDFLVLAMGAGNNFYGNESIGKFSLPMKTVGESVGLRNTILNHFEKALNSVDPDEQTCLMNMIIAGGGPTGVELAGALAEMKKYVLPKDYPELDFKNMQIMLIEGGQKLLSGMSGVSSSKARNYLDSLGVKVILGKTVNNYDGTTVFLSDNTKILSKTLIWAAGIKGNLIEGLHEKAIARGNRLEVDRYNRVIGYDNIYAIGDLAFMKEESYPNAHPQVAQVAIQQAKCLAHNLLCQLKNKPFRPFLYKDLGTLATVGRNKAVVDLTFMKFQGLPAWFFWMFIHLMAIVGVKNRLLIFINWAYHYFTYDQSLRLIIKPKMKESA